MVTPSLVQRILVAAAAPVSSSTRRRAAAALRYASCRSSPFTPPRVSRQRRYAVAIRLRLRFRLCYALSATMPQFSLFAAADVSKNRHTPPIFHAATLVDIARLRWLPRCRYATLRHAMLAAAPLHDVSRLITTFRLLCRHDVFVMAAVGLLFFTRHFHAIRCVPVFFCV